MRELLLGAAAGPALHRKQPRGGVCPPGGAQDPGLRGQAPSAVRGWSPEGPVRTPHWPPPTTPEPGGPGLLPLDPTAQATLAICLGGLAGVQGPTAQPPISWQGHTLEVSSGGRRGLGRHSPGSQAGEGTRAASHPGQRGGDGKGDLQICSEVVNSRGRVLVPDCPLLALHKITKLRSESTKIRQLARNNTAQKWKQRRIRQLV